MYRGGVAGPRIDVLLPVRRARRTLPSALGDVLAQRDVDVRVLAVVDTDPPGHGATTDNTVTRVARSDAAPGDDDGSLAWLEARAADEPRLVVLRGPGAGPGPALDLALAAVRAPLVAMMEADDRCAHDRLRRQYDFLELHPHLMGVVTRAGQFGARTPGMRRYLDWQNGLTTQQAMAAERFVEIPALFQTGLYRTQSLWAAGGFAPRGDWPIDIAFWFRWFQLGLPVQKLPRVLYRWRQHARQSTRSGGHADLDHMRACKVAALTALHGRRLWWPRPILLVSTGATLQAWRDDLAAADVELIDTVDWKPGQPPPSLPANWHPPKPPPVWGPPLIVAAYGTPSVRDKLRAALGHPSEPDALLFTA